MQKGYAKRINTMRKLIVATLVEETDVVWKVSPLISNTKYDILFLCQYDDFSFITVGINMQDGAEIVDENEIVKPVVQKFNRWRHIRERLPLSSIYRDAYGGYYD